MANYAIIGFGPFGQALARLLVQAGTENTIHCVDLEASFVNDALAAHFSDTREKLFAHGSQDIGLHRIYAQADILFVAVGSTYMLQTIKNIVPHMKPGAGLVNVAKALSPGGRVFYEEFLDLGRSDIAYAMLAGGMAAYDVMQGKVTGATLAASDDVFGSTLQGALDVPVFHTQLLDDVRGVEYASVLKNLVSIHAGYLDNTDAIDDLVRSCTQDITDHASQLGIQAATFDQTFCRNHPAYGDIRTSCYGGTRNYLLGKQRKISGSLSKAIALMQQEGITIEGAQTLRIVSKDTSHICRTLPFVQDLIEAF